MKPARKGNSFTAFVKGWLLVCVPLVTIERAIHGDHVAIGILSAVGALVLPLAAAAVASKVRRSRRAAHRQKHDTI